MRDNVMNCELQILIFTAGELQIRLNGRRLEASVPIAVPTMSE